MQGKVCICKVAFNPQCFRHCDPERPNPGQDYYDYLKQEEVLNGARRRERMEKAKMAMAERKRLGIDITIRTGKMTSSYK